MRRLRIHRAADVEAHLPLLAEGLLAWAKTEDALVEGSPVPGIEAAMLAAVERGELAMLLLVEAGEVVGFDLCSEQDGYLHGHLLYGKPERRGGLWQAYMKAVPEYLRKNRLQGFFFVSTLPHWAEEAKAAGFRQVYKIDQELGPPSIGWLKEV